MLSFDYFFLSFFRHQVTSHGRKYVRAKAGLNPYDKKAEIIRESCNGHSDMIEERPGPVLTRLFFKNIQKYVCFDRCGRLRTKVIHNSNSVVSPVKNHAFSQDSFCYTDQSNNFEIQNSFYNLQTLIGLEFRNFTKTKTKHIALSLSSQLKYRQSSTD